MAFQQSDPDKIIAAERRAMIISLRKRGRTWQDIADTVVAHYVAEGREHELPAGFDKLYAYKDFKRFMKHLNDEMTDDTIEVIRMEQERLDAMLNAIWDAVEDGDLHAVDRGLRIAERRAKLLGLDAPQRSRLVDDEGNDVRPQVLFYLPEKDDG